MKDSAYRAKVSEVFLVDEPMAAALGAGMPVTEAAGNMIIDVGGGTTDIAVISLAGVVISRSVRVAGDAFDEAIILHMKKRHELLVGERTAEEIKLQIGSATELAKPVTMEVKGRHIGRGVPVRITVSDAEIREALAEPLKTILKAVRETRRDSAICRRISSIMGFPLRRRRSCAISIENQQDAAAGIKIVDHRVASCSGRDLSPDKRCAKFAVH